MDVRAKSHVAGRADSKRQSLHAKRHIHLGAKFQQSHWECLHWWLRASDPAQSHPRKFSAKWVRAPWDLPTTVGAKIMPKRIFRGRNSGICGKHCLIWNYVLMFRSEWNNSAKHSPLPLQVCFSCGPILISLSSFLGKAFSSFQGCSSEEVNRNPGLQRHLALESPEHFNSGLGRELGFTGEQSVEIDCRPRSHSARSGCKGLDAPGILDKCWSDQGVSACVFTKPLLPRQRTAF